MFRHNVGGLDQAVRLAFGAILLPAGLFLLGGLGGSLTGLVVAAAGLIGLATGAAGYCPLYVSFGISTAERRRSKTLSSC
jgi:hypothetical protein